MRRLALVVLALAFPSAAHAAELSIAPRNFSPDEKRLRVQASLPAPARVGIQLVTTAGKPLGWVAKPQRRRFLTMRWNGRLDRKPVHDGRYLIRLVEGFKVLAETPLLIDTIAPRAMDIRARTRDRMAFQHDRRLFATISPNGDGVRDMAKISFTLTERATVRLGIARTLSRPEPIYEKSADVRPGPTRLQLGAPRLPRHHAPTSRCSTSATPRGTDGTYGGEERRDGAPTTAPVVRVLGVDAGFTRESYMPGETGLS